MGVMAIWAFRFPLPPDDPSQATNPTRGFAIVEHDFTPRPAFSALARAAPFIRRAHTGSYALTPDQQSAISAPDGLTLHIVGSRLDIVTRDAGSLLVSVDGGTARTLALNDATATQHTLASGLADGPHDVTLRIAASSGSPPQVIGYVVARRPLETWMYPWVDGVLVLSLIGVLLSLLWTVRDMRRLRAARAEPAADEALHVQDTAKPAEETLAPLGDAE